MVELTVIECGGNSEELFRQLLGEPSVFDQRTYEELIDRFRSRLTLDDIMAITAKRIRNRNYSNLLERNTLLAIVEGRPGETERLLSVLERRDRLGFKTLSPEPASPPQSS